MANIDIDLGSFDLSSSNGIAVADIKFSVARQLRQSELVGANGSVIPIANRKSIQAQVSLSVKGSDYTDLRSKVDALLSALEQTSYQKLTLDDERFLMVQYSNPNYSWKNFRTLAIFSFTLTAPDPFWYSETLQSDTRTPTSGVAYNWTNNGNARTRAKLTLTNKSGSTITDNIKFENVTTGEVFEFEGALLNNKALIVNNRVDSEDVVITNDGVDCNGEFYGDLITLNPGTNSLKYTGAASVEVKIEDRDAWK